MKKFFLILALIPFIASCSDGLNKSITQDLSEAELKTAIKRHPILTTEYDAIIGFKEWILNDAILKQQYDTITFKSLVEYFECCPSMEVIKESYVKEFPNAEAYKVQADSILNHYVGMHPDSLLTLSFKSKSVRRTMLGNFPEFYITIKPLKGTVEQFNFEYYFTPKIDGNREIDDIPYSLIRRGYQKSPISKMSTISYTGELWTDTLEDVTTEELVRDYNFIYKITNVRYQGKNWGDLPYNVKKYVEGKSDYDKEWAIESIISQDIDSSYKSLFEYYYDITSDIRREKFPTISTLFFMYENQ
jgi:hypothetical protein